MLMNRYGTKKVRLGIVEEVSANIMVVLIFVKFDVCSKDFQSLHCLKEYLKVNDFWEGDHEPRRL